MTEKHKVHLIIGIAILFLTFLITIQFKSVTVNNAETKRSNMRVDELLGYLNQEIEKNEDLQTQLEAYQNDIKEYREAAEKNSGYSKVLSEQLTRAEIAAGLVDVKGPGITITLSDIDNRTDAKKILSASDTLIHDEDIRRILNELSAAGAEAISVNDSRIISTTAVRCVGPTILVNDTKMTPPYVIRAIGNAEQLEAAMKLNGGVIDNMKVWGFSIGITKNDSLTIPKYSGTVNFKYAQPHTEAKEDAK